MKLITIIGARPQFIKAAPFSNLFRENNEELYIHTGQHYDKNMSDIFFEELRIPKPDYNLNVGSGNHGHQTGKMLIKIEQILISENPDAVLVYGDTNSTLAGALAASKLHIPVFHVEAGLRSFNKLMPEEQNRILTDHLSTLLLCPTETAVNNLEKEGVTDGVYNTGDIMYDTVLKNIKIAEEKYNNVYLNELLKSRDNLKLRNKEYYLSTIHRAENTDSYEKLKIIFESLNKLDKPVILPLHPRTKKLIEKLNLNTDNFVIIEPVGYLLMLYLTQNAHMVITDSGGLQKEAFFLKTPITTLRSQTEWVETLENDWNMLCEIDDKNILEISHRNVDRLIYPETSAFGDGKSTKKIITAILKGS